MKKLLLLTAVAALSTVAMSKEVTPAPVVVEEIVVAPVIVAPAPIAKSYFGVRVGGDLASRYEQVKSTNEFFNPSNRALNDGGELALNKKDGDGFGWEAGLEWTKQMGAGSGLELGIGAAYQKHAEIKAENYSYIFQAGRAFEPGVYLDGDVAGFDSIPLYGTARYTFNEVNFIFDGWKPYIKADIGYSFNLERGNNKVKMNTVYPFVTDTYQFEADRDIENGIYWGVGLGIDYQDWTFDIMYKVNTAKSKGVFKDVDTGEEVGRFSDNIDYSRVTLSFGYRFEM